MSERKFGDVVERMTKKGKMSVGESGQIKYAEREMVSERLQVGEQRK